MGYDLFILGCVQNVSWNDLEANFSDNPRDLNWKNGTHINVNTLKLVITAVSTKAHLDILIQSEEQAMSRKIK